MCYKTLSPIGPDQQEIVSNYYKVSCSSWLLPDRANHYSPATLYSLPSACKVFKISLLQTSRISQFTVSCMLLSQEEHVCLRVWYFSDPSTEQPDLLELRQHRIICCGLAFYAGNQEWKHRFPGREERLQPWYLTGIHQKPFHFTAEIQRGCCKMAAANWWLLAGGKQPMVDYGSY